MPGKGSNTYFSSMPSPSSAKLFLFYHAFNAYSLNVLAAAVDSARAAGGFDGEVDIVPVTGGTSELAGRLALAQDAGESSVVAWSFYSPEAERAFAQLREVKAAAPAGDVSLGAVTLHVAGGVHASAEPEETLRAGFDLVAVGEGERTLIDLLQGVLHGSYRNIRGTSILEGGRLVSHGSGERQDLDRWPAFFSRLRRFNPIEITRGCIYACKFCQTPFLFKARFRHRSVENVTASAALLGGLGMKSVRFITPTAFSYGSADESVNLEAIESLLSSVRAAMGKEGRVYFGTFPSEVRPEHVSPEALRILKRYADNDNLILGGQSGSQRILEATNRGHSVEDIERASAICLENGFLPNVDFIFGLPGETADDVEASLVLAERLAKSGARIHGHTFMPLPGTPLRNAPPGRLAESALDRLVRLESQGKLYGQWKRQAALGGDAPATGTGGWGFRRP